MSESNAPNAFEIIESTIPFHKLLGLKVDHYEQGYVRLRLPFQESFIGNFVSGYYHGGVLAAALDAVAGIAAASQVYPKKTMDSLSTMDIRVDYLKPVEGRDIHLHGQVRSTGKRAIFIRMWVTYIKEDEALVEGRAVMNVRS